MKTIFLVLIFIGYIIAVIVSVNYVFAQPIDNRKEYGYCPLTPEIISSRVQLEINGCPTIRVYVSNWNTLTPLEQSTVDTQLRTMGFKDISELDSRVR